MYWDGALAPFGEVIAESSSTDISFTGMSQDTAASLFDFPEREYNGIHGRWPSPDPLGSSVASLEDPQSWNRYAYVENNPLTNVDPTGLYRCSIDYGNCWAYGGGWAGDMPDDVEVAYNVGESDLNLGASLSLGYSTGQFDAETFVGLVTANPGLLASPGVMNSISAIDQSDPDLVASLVDHWSTDAAIEAAKERVADEMSNASRSPDGSNWDYIYDHLDWVGTGGGNADFEWDGTDGSSASDLGLPANLGLSGTGCEVACRLGSVGSLHYDYSMLHSDTANPFSWSTFGWGLAMHGVVDVLIGHINGSVPMY